MTASTNKVILVKVGKDVAVSVNKETMNESSSKNIFLRFQLVTLLHLLVTAYSGVFRTWSNIYNEAFLAKILKGFNLLTIFCCFCSIVDVPLVCK